MHFLVERRRLPVQLWEEKGKLWLKTPYHPKLVEELRALESRTWHPEEKVYSFANTQRNQFVLDFLQGKPVYAPFLKDYSPIDTPYPAREHQRRLAGMWLARHFVLWAAEMGTGKTLAAIIALDKIPAIQNRLVWYIAPKSGLKAVERELDKWESKVRPLMMTYEGLVKTIKEWRTGTSAPMVVVFDESSLIKTPSAQRTKAAQHLANAVREEWGDHAYVLAMTGTPAPKSPVDWWSQVEVLRPGYLMEPNIHILKKNLAIIEERESPAGGKYPHLIAWRDDESRCSTCGMFADDNAHKQVVDGPFGIEVNGRWHAFEPSVNEVHRLYKRLDGLVTVLFKKDCMDLPEKQFEIVRIQPSVEMLRCAQLLKKTTGKAMILINLLRELSDGFQYKQVVTGEETCSQCQGTGRALGPTDNGVEETTCDLCGGGGKTKVYSRTTENVGTPKDARLIEELENHEEVGRIVIWGGFTGTIDRLVDLCQKAGWAVLRVDGRGYLGLTAEGNPADTNLMLAAMDGSDKKRQHLMELFPKLAFIGHPKAGGMGLTLTMSPTAVYYSNSFDGQARIQSVDRIHRLGMDANRGAMIKDFICLPTDQLILDNLEKKKRLQDISLGEIMEYLANGN